MHRILTLALCLAASLGCSKKNAQQIAAPADLVAVGGAGAVTLSWSAVAGASSYAVLRGDAPGGPYAPLGAAPAATYSDASVAPGTTYYYVVQAVGPGGNSANSAEASALTAPAAPAGLTATATDTQVALQWTASAGAASYDVLRAGGSLLGTTTAPAYTDAGLTANTAYAYVVRARNASGVSPDATVSATTLAPAVAGLTATGGTGSIALSWTAIAGATGYVVRRGTAAGGPYTPIATPASSSYTDTGLPAGATYFYVVAAVGPGGTGAKSNEASATTAPAAPVGLVATGGVGQIALSWTAAGGALSYAVQRGAAAGGPYTQIGTPAAAGYVDTAVAAGTAYFYRVRAVGSGGSSPYSAEATAITAPAAPAGLTAATTHTQVSLQWTASAGAAAYDVLRAPGGTTTFVAAGTSTTTSFTDTGLTPATAYAYVVRARNASGSSSDATVNATTTPAPVAGLTATSGAAQVSLSWTAAAGASSYAVLRGTVAGGPYAQIATPSAASYVDTGLPPNTAYFYVVRAVGAGGASGNSSEVSATTAPAAPTGVTATGGAAQIALSWTAVTGATGYVVSRSGVAGGPYTQLATPTAASYTDTALAAGATYYYVVQASAPQGKSANSAEASAVTIPPTPGGLTATATDTQVTLRWTAAAGASNYDVFRPSSSTTPLGTTTAVSYNDPGLTPNTAYSYAVRARNAAGSSASATASATTAPSPVTGLAAAASNHHVTLSWTASAGASGYKVLRATASSGPYSVAAANVATAGYTDTLLANGTPYYYLVRTLGIGGSESADAGPVTATPFIEICALDKASYTVSIFDGRATGNAAPLRSFGWATAIAEATGIGNDGTNIYIASRYTQTINVYPAATVDGNAAPSRTIALPGQPTALTVDGGEIFVGIGSTLYVYLTTDTGAPAPLRTLTLPGSGVSGIGVASPTATGRQVYVLQSNRILVYSPTAVANTAPLNTITPKNTIANVTVLYGPVYDSADDAIFVAWTDYSGPVGNVAPYPRTSTTGDPVRAPITYSLVNDPDLMFPKGLILDGNNLWVATSQRTEAGSLLKFARTASGGATPAGGIQGPNTLLYVPKMMTYDVANAQYWVINGNNGALVFSRLATGNAAPLRNLTGAGSGIYDPVAIAADRSQNEVVVLNTSPGHAASIYPRSANGAVVPARSLSGSATNLASIRATSLAIDEANGEYWIEDDTTPALLAFPRAGGNVAPVRSISGTVNAKLGTPYSIAYDSKAAEIILGGSPAGTTYNFQSWPRTTNGDVAPSRTVTVPQIFSPSIDFAHDEIFATDGSTVGVYPRAFTSGSLSPSRSLNVAGSPAVDGEGDEIYFASGNSITVYSRTAVGTPSQPVRSIQGSATKLYNLQALAVCN